ncbi:MAG TPA: phosphotransferase [Actinomycetota bacterium]|nr:phosphotransferase [Actinomycetota bacterium]
MSAAHATVEDDVRRWVGDELARRTGRRAISIERRPHPYRTSFPLEELDVVFAGGGRLELAFKDLGLDGLDHAAKLVKGAGHDPRRELEAYRMLDAADLGTPKLFGTLAEPGQAWLLIERVPGVPLWQVGDREVWRATAAWLAGLHRRFRTTAAPRDTSLPVHDGAAARAAMSRALGNATGGARTVLERIDAGYGEVADWLDHAPRTLVHGDFHASNVLVDSTRRPPRIAPIDWELAAFGAGFIDLASLTAGRWSEQERAAFEAAYADADERPMDDEWLADLDRCRLHNAVSLLALPPTWRPPPEHEHDWLAEAVAAASRLGIV